MTTTKDTLADTLQRKGYADSKAGSKRLVETVLDEITAALIAGDEVRLAGFGNFRVAKRAERVGRNPHSGEQIKIEAKVIAKFKPAAALSNAVNTKKLLKSL